jgi:hypothetical protein
MWAILINVRAILYGGDFDKCGGDIDRGNYAVGRFDLHSTAILIGELQSRKFLWKFNLNEIISLKKNYEGSNRIIIAFISQLT